MGPEALRVAQHRADARGARHRGDRPRQPRRARPIRGCRRRTATATCTRSWPGTAPCTTRSTPSSPPGHLPILLGGDHCLGIGSISAVARHCRDTRQEAAHPVARRARRLQHRTSSRPSGNIHGMPVACLCGHGPQELIEIGGKVPAISPKWIRQIGIRSVDAGEKKFVHEIGLEVFDMRYIDEMGMRHTMELALGDARRRTRTCTSASTSTSSTRRSPPASAPPSPAARPTARRSCAWR